MAKSPRHLITTADERTWKFDRAVLFLGEWCQIYSRKAVWSKMDAILAAPYGLDQTEKDNGEHKIRQVEARLFPLLCEVLNTHHGMKHSPRFWKILLGHWMRTYMSTVFNRYQTIAQCLETYNVSSTSIITDTLYNLATTDSLSSTYAANDDAWNQALYARIISRVGNGKVEIESLPVQGARRFGRPIQKSAPSLRRKGLRIARRLLTETTALFQKDTDALIVNSYLPLMEEIKLQVALGQTPQLRGMSHPETAISVDPSLRKQLALGIASNSDHPLDCLYHELVMDMLPICYLESFSQLSEWVEKLNWPRHPKFIFTSNNFDSDEIFKLWAAKQAEDGTPYYTGQHGGNYGSRRIPHRSVEEETADKFLTWGWTDGLPQHVPTFLLKTAGKSAPNKLYDPHGGLLLIQECMNHRIPAWDDIAEFSLRWKAQLNFIEAISPIVRSNITIRLHPAYRSFNWSDTERLHDFDPGLAIDPGQRPMEKAISGSRLLVFSYDSSGIQEALSQNIPVIVFWSTGLDFVRESAKPFFHHLVTAGLFHFSPESAAAKVNAVFENVTDWWSGTDIQHARAAFCEKYARTTKSPITDLKKILLA